MANTAVKVAQLLKTNAVVAEAGTAMAANTNKYDLTATGKNMVLCFVPTAAGTLTIEKGTGFAGVQDITVSITASKGNWIQIDTTPFLNDDGKVVVHGDGTLAGTMYLVNAL